MPKVVPSEAREIILAVKNFCEQEKINKRLLIPLQNVIARTAAMTGVSKRTVNRIVSEGKALEMSAIETMGNPSSVDPNQVAEGPSTVGIDSTSENPRPVIKRLKLVTPGKTRKRKLTVSNLDDFDLCVIRRKIQSYYLNNSIPTLRKLHRDIKEDTNFKGSVETLRQILLKMGFSLKKKNAKGKFAWNDLTFLPGSEGFTSYE